MITLLLSKATSQIYLKMSKQTLNQNLLEQINKGMVELKSVAPAFAET
jgi:hypothetical protein